MRFPSEKVRSPSQVVFHDHKSSVELDGHSLPEADLTRLKFKHWSHHHSHHDRLSIGPTEPVILPDENLTTNAVDYGPFREL